MNKIQISGNLVKEPEIRMTASGKNVAHFTIAVDMKVPEGSPKKTSFVEVTAWDKTAEALKDMPKGALVKIEGKLQQNVWEKDGQKHSKLEVVANSVERILAKNKDTPAQTQEEAR